MSSRTKFRSRVRAIGQKIMGGIRNIGQQISGVALRLVPGLAAFDLAFGVVSAAVGGIVGGVSRIVGAPKGVLDGRHSVVSAARNIKAEAAAVK